MEHWTELRTALMVARLGTVSAAAAALGVHRATVNRHVDTLEGVFGAPLFQRHARGYHVTDAGRDMLEVARRADEMFRDLAERTRGQVGLLSGRLVVTSLSEVAPLIMPALAAFRLSHPDIALQYMATAELARLEQGEAHVAVRAGPKPEAPDYVVLPFRRVRFTLYASRGYVTRRGRPQPPDFSGHCFVGPWEPPSPLPFLPWIRATLEPEAMALRSGDPNVTKAAVHNGLGMGFLPMDLAQDETDLVQILPPDPAWEVPLWIVTHVDLHRTTKVQEAVRHLRQG